MTALIVAVIGAGWILVCLVMGRVLGGDTRLREHEATHDAAYRRRLIVLRGEAGIGPNERSAP